MTGTTVASNDKFGVVVISCLPLPSTQFYPMASSLKPHRNKVAYQHNNFVRAATKMGVIEHRIFMQALSDLTLSDKAFPLTEMTAKEVMRGLSNGESYQDVHQAVNTLVERVINLVPVHERGTRTVRVPLTARVEFDTAEGIVRVKLNEEAGPYLLNLAAIGNYTSLDVQTALDLRNPNAIKMYSILESWRNLGSQPGFAEKTETLENLKYWLLEDVDVYHIFGDFKRRVLEPVFKDFARIGYGATWSPAKTGKKTTHVTFRIPRGSKKPLGKGEPVVPGSVVTTASNASGSAGEPAPLMRVNKNEPTPLNHAVQAATAHLVGTPPHSAPASGVETSLSERAAYRLNSLKLTQAQINKALSLLENKEELLTKLMKETHPIFCDFSDGRVKHDEVAWKTINKLKTLFPAINRAWAKE